MSKYTTGEVAKLCGVTVRTVQYYDTRGILAPSELSEGGRRLCLCFEIRARMTLDPDPVEPEQSAENTSGESGNE